MCGTHHIYYGCGHRSSTRLFSPCAAARHLPNSQMAPCHNPEAQGITNVSAPCLYCSASGMDTDTVTQRTARNMRSLCPNWDLPIVAQDWETGTPCILVDFNVPEDEGAIVTQPIKAEAAAVLPPAALHITFAELPTVHRVDSAGNPRARKRLAQSPAPLSRSRRESGDSKNTVSSAFSSLSRSIPFIHHSKNHSHSSLNSLSSISSIFSRKKRSNSLSTSTSTSTSTASSRRLSIAPTEIDCSDCNQLYAEGGTASSGGFFRPSSSGFAALRKKFGHAAGRSRCGKQILFENVFPMDPAV